MTYNLKYTIIVTFRVLSKDGSFDRIWECVYYGKTPQSAFNKFTKEYKNITDFGIVIFNNTTNQIEQHELTIK